MSYTKSCNRCGISIMMRIINGRWYAFEDSMATMPHRCSNFTTHDSIVDKVSMLEKVVRKLNDKITLQQEKIIELEGRII